MWEAFILSPLLTGDNKSLCHIILSPPKMSTSYRQNLELEWVFCSNCNCYLVFFLCFWTFLANQRYARSLKLCNEISDFFTSIISDERRKLMQIPNRILFFG